MNIVVAFGGGSGDGVAVTAESTRQCEGCIVATTPDVCGGSRWTGYRLPPYEFADKAAPTPLPIDAEYSSTKT